MSNFFSDFKPYFTLKLLTRFVLSMRDELRISTIISDLTQNDTNMAIKDTQIIVEANRPYEEIGQYLSELQLAGL